MSKVLESSPSPVQLRAMLEAMVVGDPLGPAGGSDEEVRLRRYDMAKGRGKVNKPAPARVSSEEKTLFD